MKQIDIESFLQANKPQVKDNPTFLLEVQQKMHIMEGMKSEIDQQRKSGKIAFVMALLIGLITGIAITLLIYTQPDNSKTVTDNLLTSIKAFIYSWKEYLLFGIAACITTIGLILSRKKKSFI